MNKLTKFCLLVLSVVTMMSCASKNSNKTTESADSQKQEVVKPVEISSEQFASLVYDYNLPESEWKYLGDRPCIVDFYATWCGPCKMIAPILEELAAKYGNEIYVYKVDIDKSRNLVDIFKIQGVPTLYFIPQEGEHQVIVGSEEKEVLEGMVQNVLLKK